MKKHIYILLLVLALAFFIRVWQLNKVPIELFGDEIDVGVQAYSILKTGKDYHGNLLPIMFQSLTEYRLPIFIYSAVPFVAFFGLNEWGVRLTGMFWGVLGVLGIFLLAKQIFGTRPALWAALLLTISPWHLHFSRQSGIEAEMLLTIITFAGWAFLKGLESYRWLVFSVVLFALSFYTYATASLFVPFFGLSLIFLYHKKILTWGKYKLILLVLLGFVLLIPYINLYITGKSGQRFSAISIMSNQELINDINFKIKQESLPYSFIFHNKLQTFLYEISGNYLMAFSPEFLFYRGDPNLRHSIGGGMGEFYLFELATLIIGVWVFIRYKVDHRALVIAWLLTAPISSSLTRDGSHHASRLILMLIPLVLISAAGINWIISKLGDIRFKGLSAFLLVLAFVNIVFYFHIYYVDWKLNSWRFWQSGYKEALTFIKENDSNYSRIYFNNTYETTLPRFLFWYKYNPSLLQSEFKKEENIKNIVPGFDGFLVGDKYYFGTVNAQDKLDGIDKLMKKGELYMVSARDEYGVDNGDGFSSKGLKVLRTVNNPFGRPIFHIVTRL